ncbi:helix-turn-helix domain-containing protein [Actinomadura macrotermitis]|uniref:HTH cro/C1-type domain-containing protein n=1 Tax=Actinomadura macrotermitis TaxID=2585200 RepID=A0A7K0C8V1_9ACTN|nr:helix-turn-helix domain-containing protein [Actinomadura macrotermitis]MQY09885.1 hypothetical protein [Actinomadura macrotermitis]
MEIRGNKSAGAALWQALTGKAWSTTAKASTQKKTQELIDRYGSAKEVAKRLGVSKRTVERYRSGAIKNPSKKNADKFDAAHRGAKVTPGRAAKFKAGGTGGGAAGGGGGGGTAAGTGGLYIYGVISVSEDVRERGINPGKDIPDGQLENVIRIMVEQGPEAAIHALNKLIKAHYVAGMSVLEIHEIDV